MKAKVTIFKSGFLSQAARETLKQKVEGMGLVESHVPEAISDLEMTVFIEWLKELVGSTNEEDLKEMKSYLNKHKDDSNPVMDFFVFKHGMQSVVDQVPRAMKAVMEK